MSSKKTRNKRIVVTFALGFFTLLIVLAIPLFFFLFYQNRIYPNTSVTGIDLSGKTKEDALATLQEMRPLPSTITLEAQNTIYTVSTEEIGVSYDYGGAIEEVFNKRRIHRYQDLLKISEFITKRDLVLPVQSNEKLDEYTTFLSNTLSKDAVKPSIRFVNGRITIEEGKDGDFVESRFIKEQIVSTLESGEVQKIPVPISHKSFELTNEELETARERAQKFITKTLNLEYDYKRFSKKGDPLLRLLEPKGGYNTEEIEFFIVQELGPEINKPAQNAEIKSENGRVKSFQVARDGIEVDLFATREEVLSALEKLELGEEKLTTVQIATQKVSPAITTNEVNDLGIKELVGRGVSKYRGSIPGRVHNVALASSKFQGVLIEPNQIVSFNDLVGDVSRLTGYKQAYIISDGKTVLGDGGGLCQVSTTLFRAVLNAGLPVTERRAHSYRVGYYEQDSGPGLDATVYSPTTDFKFKNDTGKHLLVQVMNDQKNATLVFELYGTSDGRVAEVTKPVITSQTPPPEDLYVDDPTMPLGKVTQIEHKAWGARVVFNQKVTRNGEVLFDKQFVSSYRPWQAVYMRGTGGVTPTPNP